MAIELKQYEHTHAEIAEVLGISCERVRQIEKKALAKVRIELLRRGLGPTELDGVDRSYSAEVLHLVESRQVSLEVALDIQ